MDTDNLETGVLIFASIFTLEFLDGWVGLILSVFLIVLTVSKIIQFFRKWKYDKQKRLKEHEEHVLKIKKYRLEIEDLENRRGQDEPE